MHAVTWRSARAARRIPAQVIAGRRFPPRLRTFHRSARLQSSNGSPSEPRDPSTPSISANDNEKSQPPANAPLPTGDNAQHDVGAEIAAEAAGDSAALLDGKTRKPRETLRQHISNLKRASRVKQVEGFPPINIPEHFLKNNVTVREQRYPGRVGQAYDYAGNPIGSGPPKPETKGNLSLSWVFEGKADKEIAKLALPLPEQLYKLLEARAAEDNDAQKYPRYEDILEFVEKIYSRKATEFNVHEDTLPDKTLHFFVYLEVLAAISGSLATARPDVGSSFPSAKSNLILHSPLEGGIPRLDQLVEHVAADLQADIVKLDSQDIAELVGDYLDEGSDPNAFSLRSLGYEAYRIKSDGFELEEDEYDDHEAEEEAEDGQDDAAPAIGGRTSPAPKANKKGGFIVQGVQTMDMNDFLKALGGSSRTSSGRHAAMGTADFTPAPFGRDPSPETTRWNDMKLGAYIDALLDSTSARRRDFKDSVPTRKEENSLEAEPLVIGQGGPFKLTLNKSSQNPQSPPSQRTIVLINDYKELTATRQGARVLDKITELVHNRRKNGSEIMIVGTTSSAELVPEVSRSAIRSLQAENEDSFFRTIVVPLGTTSLKPSIEVQKSLSENNKLSDDGLLPPKPLDFDTAERRRNEAINIRHIQDMIRKLDPDAQSISYRVARLQYSVLFPAADWTSRVLAFHEVHRLVQTAIGLQRASSENSELNKDLVILAGLLLRMSDDVKFSWVAQERQKHREPKDTVQATASKAPPVKTPSEIKLEKIQKTANKHEKKLLAGVVNPSGIKTTFSDVHAPSETIDALKTMTSLSLLRPDAFKYGVLATDKIPGLLLYGPPGTGKTLLAKAVAKESGATVLEVSGSEVYDMYVGEGEKNVRAIFSLARKLSPCVVFIDEADAIFGSRSGSRHRTSHREVLNQFLKEWDGMNDLSVFIMVATNRPFDMDDAVLRRLPRRLLVDLPTQKDRESILRIHLKDEQLDSGIKLDELAAKTPFYSGSDLKNLCVAAALNCVREENEIYATVAAMGVGKEAAADADTTSPAPAAATEADDGKDATAVQGQQQAESTTTTTNPTATATDNNNLETPAQTKHRIREILRTKGELDEVDRLALPPRSSSSSSISSSHSPSPYPAKRTLLPHHFDKAMQEISASISEDMATLTAIRKFDEQYGDKRGKRKKKSSWGFNVAEDVGPGEEAARVRPAAAAAAAGMSGRR
ncbi:Protein MSP1 [Lasiodiplodia theobromae]|uniref:Protein MSP1 n=1 Tax=Lasiodiplodia theobromae TaxID=45133 RepID=A0A5N5D5Y2_9PEZI|nr:Protein MSP1 [Lasiodiplodia theobromae]